MVALFFSLVPQWHGFHSCSQWLLHCRTSECEYWTPPRTPPNSNTCTQATQVASRLLYPGSCLTIKKFVDLEKPAHGGDFPEKSGFVMLDNWNHNKLLLWRKWILMDFECTLSVATQVPEETHHDPHVQWASAGDILLPYIPKPFQNVWTLQMTMARD